MSGAASDKPDDKPGLLIYELNDIRRRRLIKAVWKFQKCIVVSLYTAPWMPAFWRYVVFRLTTSMCKCWQ